MSKVPLGRFREDHTAIGAAKAKAIGHDGV